MKNQTIKKSRKEMFLELELLKRTTDLMKNLSSKENFFKYYFSLLPKSESKQQAFEKTNEMYLELFGMYRYSSFADFKN